MINEEIKKDRKKLVFLEFLADQKKPVAGLTILKPGCSKDGDETGWEKRRFQDAFAGLTVRQKHQKHEII
ncbi:MAG: hypothetical protein JSS81_15215 [Acidobacteria bacterium]|nr:hypothetical protein [Acidobacteriota bacterium]